MRLINFELTFAHLNADVQPESLCAVEKVMHESVRALGGGLILDPISLEVFWWVVMLGGREGAEG